MGAVILTEAKEWNGKHFDHTTLKDIGLTVQLGHPVGEKCFLPRYFFKGEFVVIHSNGIHVVSLAFCGCTSAETYTRQLLRMRWFPATSDRPRTAAMFQVLEEFQLLSLVSKISGYDFYSALARRSDNTGLRPPKVCSPFLLHLCG